jgi:hypothetical protein
MTADRDSKSVAAFLENEMLEDTQSYLERGRRHGGLSDAELDRLWVTELHTLIDRYGEKNDWRGVSDIMAERQLRGRADLPQGEASSLIARLRVLSAAALDRMMVEHPGRVALKEEALTRGIADLEDGARKSPKH